jgi:hypothetical protein
MSDRIALGVAIAKRTGERRILTFDQWAELESASEARWEFLSFDRIDPVTGKPDPEELRKWGFTPGGPTVVPGELEEVEPGVFRFVGEDAEASDSTRLEK